MPELFVEEAVQFYTWTGIIYFVLFIFTATWWTGCAIAFV